MIFEEVVKLAIKQRPKFGDAIGFSAAHSTGDIPLPFSTIYSMASGTPRAIVDQPAIDIIPGFRLIHRDELEKETAIFKKTFDELDTHIPFLTDDISCYVTLDTEDGGIFRVAPEYGTSKVSLGINEFWQTVLSCYKEGAYFLDTEGFLDYDFDKEGEIGERINPECEYWSE